VNRWRFLIFFCLVFFLASDVSHAAGMLMRIQQMKAKKKQQQEMSQQEQEEYQEQQQGQVQNQQAAVQLTYQQLIDQRNQAIAQAILNAHAQAVATGNQGTENIQAASNVNLNNITVDQQQGTVPAASSNAQEVVDLSEVWKKLDRRSTVWTILIDDQAKLLTVSEYIDRFQKQGVKISNPPLHYVQAIDQIAQANPQMLQHPFGELLQILAIIDYDFDNGMDKDALAKAVLGEAGYEANKKRFSQ